MKEQMEKHFEKMKYVKKFFRISMICIVIYYVLGCCFLPHDMKGNIYDIQSAGAGFLIIIGIIIIAFCKIVSHFYNQKLSFVYLGWGTILLAISMLSEARLYHKIFPNIQMRSDMVSLAMLILPFPFLLYVNEIQKRHYQKGFYYISILTGINLVANVVLRTLGVCQFSDINIFIDIIAVLVMSYSFGTICIDIYRGKVKEYKLITIGFLVIIVCGVAGIVLSKLSIVTHMGYIAVIFGNIFLVTVAAMKSGEDMMAGERLKQHAITANEAKEKFLANMSHEIRTPINTIMGMNEMILRECEDENIHAYADNIHRASKALLGMINGILDFSKIETRQLEIVNAPYQLASLLNDMIHVLYGKTEPKDVEVLLEIDASLPARLNGDELRIRQVIDNLITNAVKYTDNGSITFRAEALWDEDENFILRITIEDTGKGIKKEDLKKIFDSFTRAEWKKNCTIEGTGLGLNITKKLVELMEGEIWVQSIYGKGSLFMIEIPQQVLSKEEIGDLKAAYEQELNKKHQESFRAPEACVLAVDDNEMNLAVVKALLKETKIKLDLASGGEECLNLCRRKKYDLIFMDHMMPEPDGIETLHRLRNEKSSQNHDTPIIALTANAVEGSRQMYLNEGFSDYLSKPVQIEKMEAAICKYLPKEKVIYIEQEADTKEENAQEATSLQIEEENTQEPLQIMEEVLIDRETAMLYCAGSEEMYQEILKAYYEQSQKYCENMPLYRQEEKWDEYAVIVHAIKSTSLTIGAKKLSEWAKEQETAAKEGNIEFLLETWEEFYALYERVIWEVELLLGIPQSNKIKETEKSQEKDSVTTHINNKKVVLVVDDDKSNLMVAQTLLSDEYKTVLVNSGERAFRYLEKNEPDLILLDIQMPQMDGFEVIKKLQKNSQWCHIPVIFLTADRSAKTEEDCFKIGAQDYIAKPFVPGVMIERVKRTLELEDYRKSLEQMVQKQLQKITQMQQDIIITMANLIESRDGTTGGHIKRTSTYVELLVNEMKKKGVYADKLTTSFIDCICKGAPMHDLGKITVPDSILQKTGRLTNEEYDLMKNHAKAGGELIRQNMSNIVGGEFLEISSNLATYHHEKWAGGGYPEGLKGEEIPLCARILAVVDVFDALVSKRQYKEGMSLEQAFDIMKKERGVAFEPEILDVFIEAEPQLKELMLQFD